MNSNYLFSLMVLRYGTTIIPAMFFTLCGFFGLFILSVNSTNKDFGKLPTLLIGLVCCGFSWTAFRWYAFASMLFNLWEHCDQDKTSLSDRLKVIEKRYDFTWTCAALLKLPVYTLFLWCIYEVYTQLSSSPFGPFWLLIPSITILVLLIH